jgi:hypothetical protein
VTPAKPFSTVRFTASSTQTSTEGNDSIDFTLRGTRRSTQ